MLELNHYSVHEIENLKDFFLVSYVIIDDIYKEIIPKNIRFRRNYNCSKLSDSEIITLAVVGELHGIPSEKAWFNYVRKNFKDLFPNLGDRSRFNRTRRNLQTAIEAVRNYIGKYLGYEQADLFIVDSMPIHVCGFGRAHFGKRFRDIASYSYCASKKETYYGFKLHALVTIEGFIKNIEITPAHVDDRVALRDLLPHNYKTTILGDKGYIGDSFAAELKEEENTLLLALKRDNAKNPYPKELRNWISKHRRRIETTFSQLTDQLNIHQVLAYSLSGLKARMSSKLLAHNIAYFMNKCLGKSSFNEVGKIKHLIFG
jgi:IS5 family transposase